MICPICEKDVRSREFYDHMGEYHGWTLSEAEIYADERYLEEHPEARPSTPKGDKMNRRDKDGAIMELKQLLADLEKIYRGERVYSFDLDTQRKMYLELHMPKQGVKE